MVPFMASEWSHNTVATQPHTLVLFLSTLLSSCLTMTMVSGAGVTSSFSSSLHIQYIEKTFSDSTNHGNFNHLVVDQNTGRLYIGAINRLYQPSETLVQEKVIITGPKDDSPYCPPEGQDCICNNDNCDDFIRRK